MYGLANFTLLVPADATQVVLPNATVDAGGWSIVGGAGSHHAGLADESAATGSQSPANPSGEILKIGAGFSGTPGPGDVTIEIDAQQGS